MSTWMIRKHLEFPTCAHVSIWFHYIASCICVILHILTGAWQAGTADDLKWLSKQKGLQPIWLWRITVNMWLPDICSLLQLYTKNCKCLQHRLSGRPFHCTEGTFFIGVSFQNYTAEITLGHCSPECLYRIGGNCCVCISVCQLHHPLCQHAMCKKEALQTHIENSYACYHVVWICDFLTNVS